MNGQPKIPGGGAQHSPKLKMAAAEIKAVLEKYDVAGVVQMFVPGTPGFNEYAMHLSPSWSCIEITDTGKLKINPPLMDPKTDKEAARRIKNTVNMVANMRIYVGQLYNSLMQSDVAVRTKFGMMPKPGTPGMKPSQNGEDK